MKVLTTTVGVDRRVNAYAPPVSCCTPGIQRMINKGMQHMRDDDQRYNAMDPQKHPMLIAGYSLEEHCYRVAIAIRDYAIAASWSNLEIQLAYAAASLHDIGKVFEPIDKHTGLPLYRTKVTYNSAQRKKKDEHQKESGRFVRGLGRTYARNSGVDPDFVYEIWTMVRHHHDPQKVRNKRRRRRVFTLHCIDIFVSLQEDRNRPGLGTTMAIVALEEILRKPKYNRFRGEANRLIRTLKDMYDFELSAPMVMNA